MWAFEAEDVRKMKGKRELKLSLRANTLRNKICSVEVEERFSLSLFRNSKY
jgi:hypothetical protein